MRSWLAGAVALLAIGSAAACEDPPRAKIDQALPSSKPVCEFLAAAKVAALTKHDELQPKRSTSSACSYLAGTVEVAVVTRLVNPGTVARLEAVGLQRVPTGSATTMENPFTGQRILILKDGTGFTARVLEPVQGLSRDEADAKLRLLIVQATDL